MLLYVITDILLKVALSTNKTGLYVLRYNWHTVESGFKTPIKLVFMLSVIAEIVLKVALSTNKTGHHVLWYNWHIVENGSKHQ